MIHGGDIYDKNIIYDFSVNLNPLGCPDRVKDALKASLENADRYPDYYQRRVREAIGKAEGVSPTKVIGGNGASELLMAVVRMISPKSALIISPGFNGYRHMLSAVPACRVIEYKLSEENDFALDEGLLEYITPELSAVIMANPNNPTGRCIHPGLTDRIYETCVKTGTALVSDESFIKLSSGGKSLADKTADYEDLYVISAYTKLFAIPGVRAGYLMAHERSIERLRGYLPEWNMSVPAQEAAVAAAEVLGSSSFLADTIKAVTNERDYLSNSLKSKGIKVYPSDTCYIMLQTDTELYEQLLSEGIMIRKLETVPGLKKGFYRIAVRRHEDNAFLIQTINSVMG